MTNTKGIFHFTCCQGASTGPFFFTKNTENQCTVLYLYLYIFRNQRNEGNYSVLNVGVYFLILCCSKTCHYSLVFVNVISQLFEFYTCDIFWNSNVPRRFNVSC